MRVASRAGLALSALALAWLAPSALAADKTFDARGIYVTATSMQLSRLDRLVTGLRQVGGNTVVFDAKDEDGIVSYRSKVPLVREIGADREGPIRDLKAKVRSLHDRGIHVAGRICLFHDPILARKRPDLALKTRAGTP